MSRFWTAKVAIKFLTSQEPDLAVRQRFLTEEQAIARLSHPKVVAVHGVGEEYGLRTAVSTNRHVLEDNYYSPSAGFRICASR